MLEKLHNDDLHDFYASWNIIQLTNQGELHGGGGGRKGAGGGREMHTGFGGEIWSKETAWKTGRRCKDNTKMDLAANFLTGKEMRTLLHGIGQLVSYHIGKTDVCVNLGVASYVEHRTCFL
jgi:hypothetical protein